MTLDEDKEQNIHESKKALIGLKVKSKSGIIGEIVENPRDNQFIYVKFEKMSMLSQFEYPNAFREGALKFVDISMVSDATKQIIYPQNNKTENEMRAVTRDDVHIMVENENDIDDGISDEQKLLNILKGYQFEGFLSFTNFPNFVQIMKTGEQYSRNDNPNSATENADLRVISDTPKWVFDYVRFYFKEKTPALYKREGIKNFEDNSHEPIPVCMVYDESLLFDKGILISEGRPGNSHTRNTTKVSEAINYNWIVIFGRGPHAGGASVTNLRNAEFMYPHGVSTNRIKKIIFRTNADYKHAVYELGNNSKFEVDPDMFNLTSGVYDADYFQSETVDSLTGEIIPNNHVRNCLLDYDVKHNTNNGYNLDLIFYLPPERFAHKIRIEYKEHPAETILLSNLKSEEIEDLNAPDALTLTFAVKNIEIIPQHMDIKCVKYLLNDHVSAIWR